MPQLLKRWERGTFDLLGQQIQLKVKAPLFDETPEFERKMMAFGRAAERTDVATKDGTPLAEDAESLFSALDPKWTRDVFTKCVRPTEPIQLEDEEGENKPIETGAQLYEIANAALILQVLHKIQNLVMLGPAEGKGSSSPSTPGAAQERTSTASSGSPATNTESEGGPAR